MGEKANEIVAIPLLLERLHRTGAHRLRAEAGADLARLQGVIAALLGRRSRSRPARASGWPPDTLIERRRFELARLKRARFGASSEKLGERVEQLERAIEALETDAAERLGGAPVVAEAVEATRLRPARRALPEHLPRESVVHAGPCTCPACGGSART